MKKIIKIWMILVISFILTGCVECSISLDYSKIKKPHFYSELTIEPQVLKKYQMSMNQIKKQLLEYDFFKNWNIKKQTSNTLIIEAPASFIKEISSIKKQKNNYILTINIDKKILDTSELNHYKNTLQLLNSSTASCTFNITMPGTIISSNIGQYSKNHVSINLFNVFIEEKELSFQIISKSQNHYLYLYLATLFILLIIIMILIFLKKRQNK